MSDQTAPVLSEEDRDELARAEFREWHGLGDRYTGADWAEHLFPAVERIVARHRQQAVREALAEVEALAGKWWQDRKMRSRMSRGYAVDLRAAIARTKGVDA